MIQIDEKFKKKTCSIKMSTIDNSVSVTIVLGVALLCLIIAIISEDSNCLFLIIIIIGTFFLHRY